MPQVNPKLLEKTASLMEKLAADKENLEIAKKELEKKAQRNEEAFGELFKMAQAKEIDWDDIPEKLAELNSLADDDYRIEIKAMEKAASGDYLNYGDLNKDDTSDLDPFTKFIVENI